uniref:Uncharacterized protein n=1 Tax=Anguilla anguilla TaxID=7936 RepID=A0A0E9Q9X7_ANGAN
MVKVRTCEGKSDPRPAVRGSQGTALGGCDVYRATLILV